MTPTDRFKDPRLSLFGVAVRQNRERLGMSQEEFAHIAGLHRTYVGSVERGERNIGLLNVFAIADALGVPATSLLDDAAHR